MLLLGEGGSKSWRSCSSWNDLKTLQWFPIPLKIKSQHFLTTSRAEHELVLTLLPAHFLPFPSPTTWNEPHCPSHSRCSSVPLRQDSQALPCLILTLGYRYHTSPRRFLYPLSKVASLITYFLITQYSLQPVIIWSIHSIVWHEALFVYLSLFEYLAIPIIIYSSNLEGAYHVPKTRFISEQSRQSLASLRPYLRGGGDV